MKKNYFMMATAATMLAACTQTDFVNEIPAEAPKAIEFSDAFINKTTRATENNQGDYSQTFSHYHKDFCVWGYKNVKGGYSQVFDGKKVSVVNESYTYDGLVAWDKSATDYIFFAAAPQNHNWTFVEEKDGTFNPYFKTSVDLTGVEPNTSAEHQHALYQPESSSDLLIASECKTTDFGSDVRLNFIHILSRLNIKVVRPQEMTRDMYVYEVSVKNIKARGNFDESRAAADPNGSFERWEIDADAPLDQDTYTADFGSEGVSIAPGGEKNLMQALIIPQAIDEEEVKINGDNCASLTQPYLYIRYGLKNEDSGTSEVEVVEHYYNLAKAFSVAELPFNEGWENTLTITVSSTAIGFTAKVSTWSAYNKSHIVQ